MTRDEIATPALLLDLDRFERNLARMADHVRRHGKALRPHAKTHRCPEIARRQVAAGALGVACAKLGEAEVMAAAGVRGLLITTEVVPPTSIRRLMKLIGEAPDTMLVVDHPDNVRALGRAAAEAGVSLNVLVDVHVGARRTGVEPGASAVALGRLAAEQRGLRLRGLQGYAGQCAHVMGWASRGEASRRAMAPLMEARTKFEKAGLPVVSIAADRAMVDAGLKAFSTDKPFPPEAVERPGVTYGFAGDEHGRLAITDPSRVPRLGERIEFFPPHCDPTFNLYDRVYAVRGQ